ncbi:MAG: hypothetical protein FD173_958 [Gallionellaceae bacterium]|nr:MAG: hypothetical protein FD173_958 [Gallionellaceae bacterium]
MEKTYHADPNNHDAVASALLNKYRDQQAGEMKFQVQELRPEVMAFALLMEQRLRDKDADKGQSWKDADIGNLQVCVTAKNMSLDTALMYGTNSEAACHAVDLANYAMMIADVAGALKLPTEPVEAWNRNEDMTFHILLMISGHNVTKDAIESWSDEQCKQAEEWAICIHLKASDNDDVEVPKVPECIIPFLVK